MIQIYTDGAASGNPGPGGYGVVLRSGVYEKELSGQLKNKCKSRIKIIIT